MLSHVEFRSDAFPPYDDEQDRINPGRYGQRLGEFLDRELRATGVSSAGLIEEDWGWRIPIEHNEFDAFIGLGNYDEYPNGFLVFIEPSKPRIRRFPKIWRSIDTTSFVAGIQGTLDRILRSSEEVYDLKWWTEYEFNNPV